MERPQVEADGIEMAQGHNSLLRDQLSLVDDGHWWKRIHDWLFIIAICIMMYKLHNICIISSLKNRNTNYRYKSNKTIFGINT